MGIFKKKEAGLSLIKIGDQVYKGKSLALNNGVFYMDGKAIQQEDERLYKGAYSQDMIKVCLQVV